MKKFLGVTVVLLAIAAGGGGYWSYQWLHKPLNISAEGFNHELKSGDSLGRMAYQLERRGILNYPRILLVYARFTETGNIKAGEYFFPKGTTPLEMLEKVERGEVINYQVTLVEGWTFSQALNILHRQPKLKALLADKTRTQQLQLLQLDLDHPEGWFFPDTYNYTAGTSDIELLQAAHQRMRDVLASEWEQRDIGLPYDNAYEALIMASIIERETGQPSERRQIAGVFVRRLQKKMRLQTDPTVIYGLGESYKGNIQRRHLKQETPYNTYVIRGLPPTPIALPGYESIAAALHPDDGTALYFVAKGDGSHHFSTTLEEHNKAVRRYQISRREKNYRSSPAETEGAL